MDLLNYVKVWNIRPSRTGYILSPDVGGVSQGCAVDLLFDFRDVARYIDDEAEGYPK
jgi:hypothetical protein